MARKPKESHRAYKEWAPSVKLVEQNIIIITHAQINGRATVFSFFPSLFLAYFYDKVFARLRVVPHFSSGIVERAKRERA